MTNWPHLTTVDNQSVIIVVVVIAVVLKIWIKKLNYTWFELINHIDDKWKKKKFSVHWLNSQVNCIHVPVCVCTRIQLVHLIYSNDDQFGCLQNFLFIVNNR